MSIESYALSDVGRKRPHNEDAFLKDDTAGLYVVADGVGGHAKGEVASAEAVEQIQNWVRNGSSDVENFAQKPNAEHLLAVRRMLECAVQQACYMLFAIAEQDPERKGMSTTISSLLIVGGTGIVAQVGDSRVYLLRENTLHQVTEDHTLHAYRVKHGLLTVEEAKRAPGKNIITRAVGHRDHVEVDTFAVDILPGDRFLLCSDGLHGELEDHEIAPLLGLQPIKEAARKLIALANARGGKDNITAVIASAVG